MLCSKKAILRGMHPSVISAGRTAGLPGTFLVRTIPPIVSPARWTRSQQRTGFDFLVSSSAFIGNVCPGECVSTGLSASGQTCGCRGRRPGQENFDLLKRHVPHAVRSITNSRARRADQSTVSTVQGKRPENIVLGPLLLRSQELRD